MSLPFALFLIDFLRSLFIVMTVSAIVLPFCLVFIIATLNGEREELSAQENPDRELTERRQKKIGDLKSNIKTLSRAGWIVFILLLISIGGSIMIPSKETMYLMLVTSRIEKIDTTQYKEIKKELLEIIQEIKK